MTTHSSEAEEEQRVLKLLEALRPYVTKESMGKIGRGRYFSNCIRSAFSVCYEFNCHAWNEKNSDAAYFLLPALRGICENLIVLNYMKGLSALDRESLVVMLLNHEVDTEFRGQYTYFQPGNVGFVPVVDLEFESISNKF